MITQSYSQDIINMKLPYTNKDRVQDALMLIGGLSILAFWLYQVGQNMIYLAK